jgi:hypothetical protein
LPNAVEELMTGLDESAIIILKRPDNKLAVITMKDVTDESLYKIFHALTMDYSKRIEAKKL